MKKINYLSNKELLSEIHKSKKTYCSYVLEEHANCDHIVDNVKEVTDELIEQVRLAKSKPWGKPPIPLTSLPPESIVIRVMTKDHIPPDTTGKARKDKSGKGPYARTNFPPFKHYIRRNGETIEVCRSHWVGGFSNGHFSADHGKMTNQLAKCFVLLSERYSNRGNWRGYSYVDEMKANALVHLCKVGLEFNEHKSQNPFAFYTTIVTNCFKRVANEEKKNHLIRDELIMMSGGAGSLGSRSDSDASDKDYYATAPRGQ